MPLATTAPVCRPLPLKALARGAVVARPNHSREPFANYRSSSCVTQKCTKRPYTYEAGKNKNSIDRDLIVSVLESANRRDAKGYFRKYVGHLEQTKPAPGSRLDLPGTIKNRALFVQGASEVPAEQTNGDTTHVAIVKICLPQTIDDSTLERIAKTLSQLRTLGLLSVVVLDCGVHSTRDLSCEQSNRLAILLDKCNRRSGAVGQHAMLAVGGGEEPASLNAAVLRSILDAGKIPIIDDYSLSQDTCRFESAVSERTVVALARLLSGFPSGQPPQDDRGAHTGPDVKPIATIESVIVLDPAGSIPMADGSAVPHRFVNLEHEYDAIMTSLSTNRDAPSQKPQSAAARSHISNLAMVKEVLSILPSSASALIASPLLAATTAQPETLPHENTCRSLHYGGFTTVKTRPAKNPLIHYLLTDKPVYSPSLPLDRFSRLDATGRQEAQAEMATLIKRGMPVTTLSSNGSNPWCPPKPGGPRLRLTDPQVDLDRLVYLMEDSFNRKLDVKNYLGRVNDNIAGVIVAGDYEGCAILTWEVPPGLSEEEAYESGRLVPYLDKFAVLKSRQGSGGVADIVFNAMVQDCFPQGVCWRSKTKNPVNKWYFERSVGGTKKLSGTEWAMFWTTTGLEPASQVMRDYEDVCRGIEPSWAV